MTHFEVLGFGLEGQILGLKACKSSKMPCSRPRTLNCWKWSMAMSFFHFVLEIGISWREGPFVSFWRTPALCVLGLEHSCPRPRKVSPWPWSRIFLYHWPRLRTLFPRLHLCPWQIINYTVSEKNATWGVKNVIVKLNITIIVWMDGKMRSAVNQFFTRRH